MVWRPPSLIVHTDADLLVWLAYDLSAPEQGIAQSYAKVLFTVKESPKANRDESSDDDRNAGQLVIRRSPNYASQGLIRHPVEPRSHNTESHRSAEPRSYYNESRSHSHRQLERPARSDSFDAEPANIRFYRVGAAPQRNPPRHIRREHSDNEDAARLRNIARLEVVVAELEERLRNCGLGSRSGHSSSRHGGDGNRSTNHATDYDEDDHCWCCDSDCGR